MNFSIISWGSSKHGSLSALLISTNTLGSGCRCERREVGSEDGVFVGSSCCKGAISNIFVDAFNVNAFIVVVGEIVIYFDCDIIVVIIRDSGQIKVGKYKVKLL
jgi:hypothetical protein